MTDRRVYAELANGAQIVRYDRAGKWYIENGPYRRQITMAEAVLFVRSFAEWRKGVPGGTLFDKRVAAKLTNREGGVA